MGATQGKPSSQTLLKGSSSDLGLVKFLPEHHGRQLLNCWKNEVLSLKYISDKLPSKPVTDQELTASQMPCQFIIVVTLLDKHEIKQTSSQKLLRRAMTTDALWIVRY